MDLNTRFNELDAESERLEGELPGLKQEAESARERYLLDPSPEAEAAAEAAARAFSAAIERRDAVERDLDLLERAAEREQREAVARENQAQRERLAAAGPALEKEILEGAPAVQRWAATVLVREGLRGRPVSHFGPLLVEWITGQFRVPGTYPPHAIPPEVAAEAAKITARVHRGEVVP